MKYKIVTDASVDIDSEIVKKYDISVLPIEVRFKDELYPEGLDYDEFYSKLRTTGIIPKTSQPNQFKFEKAYNDYVNKEDWFVITIVISSGLAGTISQAKNATANLSMTNNYICDGQMTSFAQGMLVEELCKYIDLNPKAEPNAVIEYLESLKRKIRLYVVVGDLKYLKLGGRLSSASYFVANALNVRPIITIEDGVVKTVGKKVGAQADKFIVELSKNRDTTYPIYFGHADCKAKIDNFIAKFASTLKVAQQDALVREIGCVVGTHVGPDCYGVVFVEK